MPNTSKTIEENILECMRASGKSINSLAKDLGVTQPHLTKILRLPGMGTEKRPLSPSLLDKINQVLETDFKLQK